MKYLSLTEDKYLTDKANGFMVLDLSAHDWETAIVYYNLSYPEAKRIKQVLLTYAHTFTNTIHKFNTNEKTQSIKELFIVCHKDDRKAIEEELFYGPIEW